MRRILIALSLLSFFISCRRGNIVRIQFPAETQNGLNTFGCYVDGNEFIPSATAGGAVRPISVYYTPVPTYYQAGFLSIQGIDARFHLDFAGNVLIQKLQVFGVGEYSLSHVPNCAGYYTCDDGGYRNAKENKDYFIESGKLTITRLDTVNKIISGRFYFSAKDMAGNRKEITNGVFDTPYIH